MGECADKHKLPAVHKVIVQRQAHDRHRPRMIASGLLLLMLESKVFTFTGRVNGLSCPIKTHRRRASQNALNLFHLYCLLLGPQTGIRRSNGGFLSLEICCTHPASPNACGESFLLRVPPPAEPEISANQNHTLNAWFAPALKGHDTVPPLKEASKYFSYASYAPQLLKQSFFSLIDLLRF